MHLFRKAGCLFVAVASTLLSQTTAPVSRQYTVSSLPAASTNTGVYAVVRDGASPLDCSTGGGNLTVTCVSNGTTWVAQSAGASSASTLIINNAGTTGTTLNKLAKLTGTPSTATITNTSDTAGAMGVVIAGAGITGATTIQTYGMVNAIFDGATTAGDYVQISTTAAGSVHDSGTSYPSSGQVLGRVLSTNGSGGTYQMFLFATDVRGFGSGTAIKLLASVSETPSAIPDGTCAVQGSVISIGGTVVGDPVSVGVNPALAAGVVASASVTSAGTVSVTFCNQTGASVTPPSSTVSATVVH